MRHFFSVLIMKYFQAFFILFSAIFLLAVQPDKSLAQSECCGTLFGIPICTGFCVELDSSSVHKKINKLEKSADSLRKEAERLDDSLAEKIRHNDFRFFSLDSKGNLRLDGDSTHWSGHWPDSLSIKGWTNAIPKDYHFEMPNIPEYKFFQGKSNPFSFPKENKKRTPVKGFKGWYMQELAELGE